ncbi:hypothetical protein R3P38DRAFT_1462109 [Favolaschia claudopus]|uniref:Uncharacterized protein n=1 Tax=Favolaschia claudopus TaxID=2862362 RepID=A0AAW0DQQ2_9AGAR
MPVEDQPRVTYFALCVGVVPAGCGCGSRAGESWTWHRKAEPMTEEAETCRFTDLASLRRGCRAPRFGGFSHRECPQVCRRGDSLLLSEDVVPPAFFPGKPSLFKRRLAPPYSASSSPSPPLSVALYSYCYATSSIRFTLSLSSSYCTCMRVPLCIRADHTRTPREVVKTASAMRAEMNPQGRLRRIALSSHHMMSDTTGSCAHNLASFTFASATVAGNVLAAVFQVPAHIPIAL